MDSEKLFTLISSRDLAGAQALLEAEPELADARMANGVSLLLMSVYYGQPEIAEAIRRRRSAVDVWEATALAELKTVTNLVAADGTLLNAAAADGFAPLGLAAYFGHLEILSWLLEHGADADQPSQNEMRVRPVHSAAAHRNAAVALAMMEQLISHGAQLNVPQEGGWTPLHQAADQGHSGMVTLLLTHGADRRAKSENDMTPLAMAEAREHTHTLEVLRNSD